MSLSIKKQPLYWFLRGLSCLPKPLLYALARLLAFFAWHLNSDMRRITELNLAHCKPDMNAAARANLARQSVLETANVAVEMLLILFQAPELNLQRIASVKGKALIDDILARGQGVIIVAPHLGNWEYLGLYLCQYYDCMFMFKPGKSALMDQLISHARSQTGAQLMPTNKTGVMGMLKHLKQGGVSGILPDQAPEQAQARTTAPFFMKPAPTMSLVSSFAKKPKIEAVSAFAKRLPNKQFEIIIEAVDAELYSADLTLSTAALNRSVERLIEQAPAQYQWEYKRFKYDENGAKHALYKKSKGQ